METRQLICIGCPMGCPLTVELEGGAVTRVTGNTCPRGDAYGRKEVTDPTRIVTTTVRVRGGVLPAVSCKTRSDVPKGRIFDVVRALKDLEVPASGGRRRHRGGRRRHQKRGRPTVNAATRPSPLPAQREGARSSVSQKRHAPGGTHFCAQSRDRNSFPLVSPWGQNLAPNHALAARRLAHSRRQISLYVSRPSAHVGWTGLF